MESPPENEGLNHNLSGKGIIATSERAMVRPPA
jgi:hypothetical protein